MPLVFDIETNGLLADVTKLHCINIYDTESHKHERYDQDNLPVFHGVKRLQEAEVIVGHNIIGYDIPALKKLYPDFKPTGNVIDTYIWACCTWPNIKDSDFSRYRKGTLPASLIGKHTLESYGYRLGVNKGEFGKSTDWQHWTPEMSDYCEQDVVVTCKLLDVLSNKNTSWDQVELEMAVNAIISRQTLRGVLFDKRAAEELYCKLAAEREKLKEELTQAFPPFYKRKGKLFTPKRDMKKRAGEWVGYVADAQMQRIELVEFNPGSAVHVARMLMKRFDWIPEEFSDKEQAPVELRYQMERLGITEKTVPTVNDEIVKRFDYPEIQPLARYMMLNKRCSQISEGNKAWFKYLDEKTSRIHGAAYQFGAVTGRFTHFNPNLAQVPAVYSEYGKECRALFGAPPGYKFVGCDADGLEARCKAHYLHRFDNGAFVKTILEGKKDDGTDIHSLNRDRLGFTGKKGRDTAKTWYYAFMYGAGDLKLGKTAMENPAYQDYKGDPAKLGKKLRAKLSAEFTGLKDLISGVQSAAARGWLKGLDGRRIPIRSTHAALNSLLQSAGAVVMKKGLVIADRKLKDLGLVPIGEGGIDYEFVLNVHDEWQCEVLEKHTDTVGSVLADAIREAGEHYKFKCPLAGSYDVGNNWAETH